MCGIVGFPKEQSIKTKESLAKIFHRGLDNQLILKFGEFCFGHCLHSVVNDVPQPLTKDNYAFGANCEIYNWQELNKKYNFNAENDAELLFSLLIKKGLDCLEELDGVYAFFFYDRNTNKLSLARDIFGVKPLWFSSKDGFSFASERKALPNSSNAEELNPRNILEFRNGKTVFVRRQFQFVDNTFQMDEAIKHASALLENAVLKRIPNESLALLFSGGLDSTVLAFILKKHNIPFKAYYTYFEEKSDFDYVSKMADKLGIDLKKVKVYAEDLEVEIPVVVKTIESLDPVKVEVASTLHFSLKAAKKDKIKVILSGLGSDDIFAGYKRMLMSLNVKLDSISSLRRIYERDLYRDDTISMLDNIELRLPFLDHDLVSFIVGLPDNYKLGDEIKPFLRKIAKCIGMEDLSEAKRKAAQYGSGISFALSKLSNKNKANYLQKFDVDTLRLGVLFTGGKDSVYALNIQKRLNYRISVLITLDSKNPDSYMFHTPIFPVKYQAKALNIPFIMQETEGVKEEELKDLESALIQAKKEFKIQGIVTGALFSNYQRSRIEDLCDKLNLKVFSPLWHIDQEVEMRSLIKENYKIIMTKVAADNLDSNWLNKILTEDDINKLVEFNKKFGFNVAGEGGEFESLVLDCPLFSKRLKINKAHVNEENSSATLFIEDISLEEK